MSENTENADQQAKEDKKLSKIDAALAAVQKRKEAKANGTDQKPAGTTASGTATTSKPATNTVKKPTEEEKAAKIAQRAKEAADRKAKRDADRAEKLKIREANRQPAHMKKVQKAAEKLGKLGQAAQLLYNEATTNLAASELATLALHIQHFNRSKSTERALGTGITAGMEVEITGGDVPKYVGMRGIVVKSQRIRCYVNIEGENNRPVPGTDGEGIYFYTSDVRAVKSAESTDDNEDEDNVEETNTTDEPAAETTEEPIAATG